MPVTVFIASAREATKLMDEVAVWVEEAHCSPMRWTRPELFLPGDSTFQRLQEIAGTVDAAILLFTEDDVTWYRGNAVVKPRDNVLVEYGLFSGRLGQHRAAICTCGNVESPSDLAGIVTADLTLGRREFGRAKVLAWLNQVDSGRGDPLSVQLALLRRQQATSQEELNFLRTANADLVAKLSGDGITPEEARYQALFTYAYVWQAQQIFAKYYRTFDAWNEFLSSVGFLQDGADVSVFIDTWSRNRDRLPFVIRKTLRVVRRYYGPSEFAQMVKALPPVAREELLALAPVNTFDPDDGVV